MILQYDVALVDVHVVQQKAIVYLILYVHTVTVYVSLFYGMLLLVRWRGGATGRVLDLLRAKLRNNLGQVVHTFIPSVTKQYNLVPAKGR